MARLIEAGEPEQNPNEINVVIGNPIKKSMIEANDPFHDRATEMIQKIAMAPNTKRKAHRLEKLHQGADGAGSKKLESQDQITGYALFDVVMPPFNLDYLAKLYEVSAPNYSAINAKVSNIVALGYDFVNSHKTKEKIELITRRKELKEKTTGYEQATAIQEGEQPEIPEPKIDPIVGLRRGLARHKTELYDWLDAANEEDTFTETLIKVFTDYEATGNGYLEVGRTTRGEIGYIGHVPATMIRIRKERDGFIQLISNKAVFFRNFGDTFTTDPVSSDPRPNELIHLKKYSPTSGYYGVPNIIAAKQALAGNEFAGRFNLDYFENKAVPRYVVVIKGGTLSNESEGRILEFFESLKATNHRTLIVPLPADDDKHKVDFKMEPIETGVQDSSFEKYRKSNLNEILMAHRVPISKIGLAEGVSLAVARDADKTFKEQVCRPEQKILEKKLNRIIAEKTDAFTLKLNELSLSDELTLAKMDEIYLRNGVMQANDVRVNRWGWEAIIGGDEPKEMKPAVVAEQKAQAGATRERDADRASNAPDKDGESRNPQGEGRQQS